MSAQVLPRPVHKRLDGGQAGLHHLANLLVTHLLYFVQGEGDLLVFRQFFEGGGQNLAPLFVFQIEAGVLEVDVVHRGYNALKAQKRAQGGQTLAALLFAQVLQRFAHGNAVDPGGEFGAADKTADGAVDFYKDALDDVGGIALVVQKTQAGVVDSVLVLLDQLPEGGGVAPLQALDEWSLLGWHGEGRRTGRRRCEAAV